MSEEMEKSEEEQMRGEARRLHDALKPQTATIRGSFVEEYWQVCAWTYAWGKGFWEPLQATVAGEREFDMKHAKALFETAKKHHRHVALVRVTKEWEDISFNNKEEG